MDLARHLIAVLCLGRFKEDSMPVNNATMQRSASTQTNLKLLKSDTLRRQRSERFVYRELTLPPQIWVRLYDDLGRVVEESLCNSDGALIFRWIYLYDEQGRRAQGNLHNGKGVLVATSFYDEHQTVIQRIACNDAGLANAA